MDGLVEIDGIGKFAADVWSGGVGSGAIIGAEVVAGGRAEFVPARGKQFGEVGLNVGVVRDVDSEIVTGEVASVGADRGVWDHVHKKFRTAVRSTGGVGDVGEHQNSHSQNLPTILRTLPVLSYSKALL